MQQTLWGETKTHRRQRRSRQQKAKATYSITDGNDCEILGHTLNHFDLAGCTVCLDCGVNVFCPGCIEAHPTDENAVPVLCDRHEEGGVRA